MGCTGAATAQLLLLVKLSCTPLPPASVKLATKLGPQVREETCGDYRSGIFFTSDTLPNPKASKRWRQKSRQLQTNYITV